MAWQGKVVQQTVNIPRGTVSVLVEFADAASPATVLAAEAFEFPADAFTAADAQREIKARGAFLRANYTEIQGVANYVGTVISNI